MNSVALKRLQGFYYYYLLKLNTGKEICTAQTSLYAISSRATVSRTMSVSIKSVLISDEVDQRCADVLTQNGIKVVKNTKLTKEQLVAEIPKYDGLIVRSATKVTADVINAGNNLKIIGRAGTGVDNIDCNAATKRGVIVMNTPGGNTLSAAEHTCAMIISLSREIPRAVASLKEGRWDRKMFMGTELNGKTLGIIGLGRIGKEVALRMQSFGMTTVGFDPIVSAEESAEFNVEWLPLDKLWPQVDYVTVHTPLIPQTANLIGERVFSICKRGMRVINVARGGIIDEVALVKALDAGTCGGAGLDVFLEEPPTNRDLVNHPKVVCTPHLGANTVEAQSRVAVEIAEQFVDVTKGKSLFGAINAQALANALSPASQPIVRAGQSLGSLAGAMLGEVTGGTKIEVLTQGANLKGSKSYLGAAVLAGLLKGQAQGKLNLINAPALAKELGVQVECSHDDEATGSYTSLVSVKAVNPDGVEIRLKGVPSSATTLLVEISGATFAAPVSLHDNTLIFRASSETQNVVSIVGTLISSNKNGSDLSFSLSTVKNGEIWGIVGLTSNNVDLVTLKSKTTLVKQIAL